MEAEKNVWEFLEHNGPVFAPPYESLPEFIKFKYNGQVVRLSQKAEEVAVYYARKLHLPCVTNDIFNRNFFNEWREVMNETERNLIQDLSKCDFKAIHKYYKENTNKINKLRREKQNEKYKYCTIDGKKELIKNYKIEPPDLFVSIGESPLTGKLKTRITPEEVIINCSSDSKIPTPPLGFQWKEVVHNNKVSWLASWVSNVTGKIKHIILDERSNRKQMNDRQKYEIARQLHEHIEEIRENYRADWEADDYEHRQRGVALYFIDTLGLRAGNEPEEGRADTAGCCSLKVKYVTLLADNKVKFDFKSKASIEYKKTVTVELQVYNNLISFMENKNENYNLFDQLNTKKLNDYLKTQNMPNLTAKVFRTYLASTTFEKILNENTYACKHWSFKALVKRFKQANDQIAILLNHKKTKKQTDKEKLQNMNSTQTKIFASRTSLAKYIDPRIVVTWCERFNIPIEKVYTKELREKFQWAIEEAGPNFLFCW